ncbi:hypothetical protein F4777DRAFT_584790 [Nemania sp. FL0916]|nr:hypothetical protein F4777DRAFT_584790 [Nemania sp. FL0916]
MNSLTTTKRVPEIELAISSFRAALTDEQQRHLSSIRNVPDADAILIFTAQLDHQNRSRRGQSVGSRVSKVLQSTRDFCSVIDTYVSSNPNIAALVWGSIVINLTSYYEAVSGLFLQLGHLCPLFAEYGALFPTSKEIQKSVSDFHVAIVRCWQYQLFQAFCGSFNQEFQPDIEDIRRYSDNAKDIITLARAHSDAQERKLQAKERTAASSYRKLSKALLLAQSHDRKQKILEAFCSYRPERLLKQNQRKRFRNTASWIVHTEEFRNWISPTGSVLWCTGKIGSGKSVVAASIVDYMLLEKGKSDFFLSYFFLHTSERESLAAETVIKSLVRQRLPQANHLSDEIEAKLRRLNNDGDFDGVLGFLCDITDTSRPSYIIIDGLDECDEPDLNKLLEALSSLITKVPSIKLFLAGRESVSMKLDSYFASIVQISMDSQNVRQDIVTYITGILEEKRNRSQLVVGDSGLLDEIEIALIEGADGMFLWVFFQVEDLCEQTCDEDIRRTIANLPQNLEETYRRVLRRITSRRHSQIARKIFPWIAAAVRPLSLEELREAIAIEIGQHYTKPELLCNDMNKAIVACENLLHVDEEDGSVQFAHNSIRQFLVKPSILLSSAHGLEVFLIDLEKADHFAGEICITYLHFNDFQTALIQQPARPKLTVLPDPLDIAHTALGSGWNIASKLKQKGRSHEFSAPIDAYGAIKPRTELTWKAPDSKHPFLKYASTNWILHTKNFREDRSQTWNLWNRILVKGHPLVVTLWRTDIPNRHGYLPQLAMQENHYAIAQLIDNSTEFWRPHGWEVIRKTIQNDASALHGARIQCRELVPASRFTWNIRYPLLAAVYTLPPGFERRNLDIVNSLQEAGAEIGPMNVGGTSDRGFDIILEKP